MYTVGTGIDRRDRRCTVVKHSGKKQATICQGCDRQVGVALGSVYIR